MAQLRLNAETSTQRTASSSQPQPLPDRGRSLPSGFPFHLLSQDSRTADSVVFSPGRALESPVELQKQISVRATPPDPVNHNWGFSPGCRCCESFPGASQGQTRLSVSRLSGNFYDSL